MTHYITYYHSPIGILQLEATEKAIIGVNFVEEETRAAHTNALLDDCAKQLEEYFNGTRQRFSLPIDSKGTNFQQHVWQALQSIPYAHTQSYKDVAETLKHPKAVRAVGNANNKNKISVIVPCHRVVGSNGKLTGYAGGLWRKEWLLEHEKKFA